MFLHLSRLASYLALLEQNNGEGTYELILALEDAFNCAHLELWLTHQWDTDETAMKKFPIICEAAYACLAAQVAN